MQHAEFNMPRIESSRIETEINGTSLAVRLTELCVEISESIPSAKFDNLTAGPAVAPVLFPLGILADEWPDPPFVGFYFTVDPRESDISFDPRLVKLLFNTGEIVEPTTIWLVRGGVKLELKPNEKSEKRHTPIQRFQFPVAVQSGALFDIRYDEPRSESLPVKLLIEGVSAGGTPVSVPEVYFDKITTTRILVSGQYINGSWSLDNGCEHF